MIAPSDATGLKFRTQTSDVAVAMIEAMGASAQKLAFSEVYGALQTGVVDGQENTWSNIYSKKFFEVQDGVTETNHQLLTYLAITSAWAYAGIAVMLVSLFLIERKYPEAINRFEENALAFLLTFITLLSFVQVVLRYGFHSGIEGALELISADWLVIFGAKTNGGAVTYWSKKFVLNIGLEDIKFPTWIYEPLGWDQRVKRWVAYLILPVGLSLLAFRATQATIDIIKGKRELIIAGHEAEDLVAENKDVLKEDV